MQTPETKSNGNTKDRMFLDRPKVLGMQKKRGYSDISNEREFEANRENNEEEKEEKIVNVSGLKDPCKFGFIFCFLMATATYMPWLMSVSSNDFFMERMGDYKPEFAFVFFLTFTCTITHWVLVGIGHRIRYVVKLVVGIIAGLLSLPLMFFCALAEPPLLGFCLSIIPHILGGLCASLLEGSVYGFASLIGTKYAGAHQGGLASAGFLSIFTRLIFTLVYGTSESGKWMGIKMYYGILTGYELLVTFIMCIFIRTEFYKYYAKKIDIKARKPSLQSSAQPKTIESDISNFEISLKAIEGLPNPLDDADKINSELDPNLFTQTVTLETEGNELSPVSSPGSPNRPIFLAKTALPSPNSQPPSPTMCPNSENAPSNGKFSVTCQQIKEKKKIVTIQVRNEKELSRWNLFKKICGIFTQEMLSSIGHYMLFAGYFLKFEISFLPNLTWVVIFVTMTNSIFDISGRFLSGCLQCISRRTLPLYMIFRAIVLTAVILVPINQKEGFADQPFEYDWFKVAILPIFSMSYGYGLGLCGVLMNLNQSETVKQIYSIYFSISSITGASVGSLTGLLLFANIG